MSFRPSWPKGSKPKWFGSLSVAGNPTTMCPFCGAAADLHEEGTHTVKEDDGEILLSNYGVGTTFAIRWCDGKKPALN